MKKCIFFNCNFLIVTLALLVSFGFETSSAATSKSATAASTTANADSGRLVVRRVANIGTIAIVNISVDGKRVGSISRGQTYNAPLSAGPHVVTASLTSSNTEAPSAKKSVTVQSGQTYAFTASWKRGALSLD